MGLPLSSNRPCVARMSPNQSPLKKGGRKNRHLKRSPNRRHYVAKASPNDDQSIAESIAERSPLKEERLKKSVLNKSLERRVFKKSPVEALRARRLSTSSGMQAMQTKAGIPPSGQHPTISPAFSPLLAGAIGDRIGRHSMGRNQPHTHPIVRTH